LQALRRNPFSVLLLSFIISSRIIIIIIIIYSIVDTMSDAKSPSPDRFLNGNEKSMSKRAIDAREQRAAASAEKAKEEENKALEQRSTKSQQRRTQRATHKRLKLEQSEAQLALRQAETDQLNIVINLRKEGIAATLNLAGSIAGRLENMAIIPNSVSMPQRLATNNEESKSPESFSSAQSSVSVSFGDASLLSEHSSPTTTPRSVSRLSLGASSTALVVAALEPTVARTGADQSRGPHVPRRTPAPFTSPPASLLNSHFSNNEDDYIDSIVNNNVSSTSSASARLSSEQVEGSQHDRTGYLTKPHDNNHHHCHLHRNNHSGTATVAQPSGAPTAFGHAASPRRASINSNNDNKTLSMHSTPSAPKDNSQKKHSNNNNGNNSNAGAELASPAGRDGSTPRFNHQVEGSHHVRPPPAASRHNISSGDRHFHQHTNNNNVAAAFAPTSTALGMGNIGTGFGKKMEQALLPNHSLPSRSTTCNTTLANNVVPNQQSTGAAVDVIDLTVDEADMMPRPHHHPMDGDDLFVQNEYFTGDMPTNFGSSKSSHHHHLIAHSNLNSSAGKRELETNQDSLAGPTSTMGPSSKKSRLDDGKGAMTCATVPPALNIVDTILPQELKTAPVESLGTSSKMSDGCMFKAEPSASTPSLGSDIIQNDSPTLDKLENAKPGAVMGTAQPHASVLSNVDMEEQEGLAPATRTPKPIPDVYSSLPRHQYFCFNSVNHHGAWC
jgi:hypothetical protein